jgi:hypothetical protein
VHLRYFCPARGVAKALNTTDICGFSALYPGQKFAQIHPAGLIRAYLMREWTIGISYKGCLSFSLRYKRLKTVELAYRGKFPVFL